MPFVSLSENRDMKFERFLFLKNSLIHVFIHSTYLLRSYYVLKYNRDLSSVIVALMQPGENSTDSHTDQCEITISVKVKTVSNKVGEPGEQNFATVREELFKVVALKLRSKK